MRKIFGERLILCGGVFSKNETFFAKNFGDSKRICNFAAFKAKNTILFAFVGFFIATSTATNAVNIGFQPRAVYHNANIGKRSLPRIGGESLSFFTYINFLTHMAKNEENCGPTKNSNRQARLANENGLSVPTIPLQASTYPIATFDDYIVESSRRFDIEKNEKNMLYAFIDLLGLSEQYEEFRKEFSDFNPHELCLIILGLDRSCRSADSYLDCATLPMFLKSNN